MADYVFYAKYAKYNTQKGRRETWVETIDRVFKMHSDHLKKILNTETLDEELLDYMDMAKLYMRQKRVLGSQRALQFGGDPILKHSEKIFNCSALYIDKARSFQEVLYILLCGCGSGFSVQKHHIAKLPNIKKHEPGKPVRWVINDSIEGWADALGVLMQSYFEDPLAIKDFKDCGNLRTGIEFDFSHIRPEGAIINGGFIAPGPKGLQQALIKIQDVIERRLANNENRLHPIDAYDILMHSSDAVLSGGVRRAACIALFSKDDDEMMKAKTGEWLRDNPQRGRSNNSVIINRNQCTKDEFKEIIENIKQFGEPGFVFVNDFETLVNPCLPSWSTLLTSDGLRELKDIKVGDEIWSKTGWTKVVKKWSTGIKDVWSYQTSAGTLYCTENHRLLQNGEKVEAKNCKSIDAFCYGPELINDVDIQYFLDGICIGSFTPNIDDNGYMNVLLTEDQVTELSDVVERYPELFHKTKSSCVNEYTIKTSLVPLEFYDPGSSEIPSRIVTASIKNVNSFMQGYYFINSKAKSSITALSKANCNCLQMMLSAMGVLSTSKLTKVKDVDIYTIDIRPQSESSDTFDILEKSKVSTEEVFDITVDNNSHTFWCNGFDISNCCEISFNCHDAITNETGVSFCNLCEINIKKCKTEEDFYSACKAAAVIGTIQASYTDFSYLSEATKNIVKKESLLGVSMTGMMDSPEIAFDPAIQRKGSKIIKKINEQVAKLININPCARATCVKPSGSASLLLGSSSGIHPQYARRYIRRIQANVNEFPLKYFESKNPLAVETSVWSNTGTDKNIMFTCDVPAGSITKNQLSAIELLEKVKLTQQNWVEAGTTPERSITSYLRHNVSNTISVKPEEWEDVTNYLYNNKNYFTGVSLLSVFGDKDFPQAPITAIYTAPEIAKQYGNAAMFASGLIVHAQEAFNNNLWKACNCANGLDSHDKDNPNQCKWMERIDKFAKRYFDGDIKRATYLLKDVDNLKLWTDLNRTTIDVDWSEVKEEDPYMLAINTTTAAACAGGKCEL